MMSKSVVFIVDARADLNEEEKANVKKYNLGKTNIYNSERTRRSATAAQEAFGGGTAGGFARGLAHAALAGLSLSITVDSLTKGQHIECKDLDEVLGAEEAVKEACQYLRAYLDTATTFDGREEVVEF
jgi:hypothetical protein